MAGKIFISYRREDSMASAGRLYDFLENEVGAGSLFKDVDSLPYGSDFPAAIRRAIDQSTVVLVLIGNRFLTDERRLFSPGDYVRMEIAYALAQGKVVIPVLVDQATMPAASDLPPDIQSLITRNGPELRHGRWRSDCLDFLNHIKPILGAAVGASSPDDGPVEQAVQLYQAGKYADAFRLLNGIRKTDRLDARGHYYLALMYVFGRGVEKNVSEAIAWYRRAADQGYAPAQNNLAGLYARGLGVKKDDKKAVALYQKAAAQGLMVAQSSLGYFYEHGFGVARNYAQAARWYHAAAEQGNPIAQHNLAYMYEQGRGVTQDIPAAIRWYRQAAAQGVEEATQALQRLT